MVLAESLGSEVAEIVHLLSGLDAVGVPGVAHDEVDGGLAGLQVAHVDNPDAVDARLVSQVQLLAHLGNGGGVHPSVVPRPAVHVDMVIETQTALPVALLLRTNAADVTPVVVAEEQGHVVGSGQPGIIVPLHFRIDRPELRNGGGVFAVHPPENVALTAHHLLQRLDILGIVALAHRHVAVAAHANGDEVLVVFVALHALKEEAVDARAVRHIVPRPHLVAALAVLVVRAHHRLVVGGAHHDAVLIGQIGVHRVVLVEVAAPHRRPQVVGLQTQQQFKQVGVHLGVVAPEVGSRPGAERRLLVVDEDATIFHLRRRLHVAAVLDVQSRGLPNGHVSPPVPRRHAYLFRQVVEAVDGAALVAADHVQVVAVALDDVGLPLPPDVVHLDRAFLHHSVNQRALAERTDDHRLWHGRSGLHHLRFRPRHPLDVGGQVAGCAHDALPVVLCHHDPCRPAGC